MTRVQIYTAKKKRWHLRRYNNRISQGLCPTCGGQRTGEWIVCEACREKVNIRRKIPTPETRANRNKTTTKYRINCRKAGICYGCGCYIGLGKYKRCKACRERDRLAHAEAYIRNILRASNGGKEIAA